MKTLPKLIVLSYTAFLTFSTLLCQDKIDTINVNFLEMSAKTDDFVLKYGKSYRFRIYNINKSLFKIEENLNQQDFNSAIPGILNSMPIPSGVNTSKAAAETMEIEETVIEGDSLGNLKKNQKTINASIEQWLAALDLSNKVRNLSASCELSYYIIEDSLVKLVNSYLKQNLNRKAQASELRKKLANLINDAIAAKMAMGSSLDAYSLQMVFQMQKYKEENKIEELVNLYNTINPSNFSYETEPIYINSDELRINFKITANSLLPCDIPSVLNYSHTYKVKGGWKVDFSTGVFLSFGNDDFYGRHPYYKPINDSMIIIKPENVNRIALLNLGALMHIYSRTSKKVNVAISPGVSTNIELNELNLHLGLSLVMGNEDRFIITAGAIIKESTLLDSDYEFNVPYNKSNLPDDPPTINAFPRVGFSVSVTYNFSKFKS